MSINSRCGQGRLRHFWTIYQLDNAHFLFSKLHLLFKPLVSALPKAITLLCYSFKFLKHKITSFCCFVWWPLWHLVTLFCLRIQWLGGLLILKKNFGGCLKKFVVMLRLFWTVWQQMFQRLILVASGDSLNRMICGVMFIVFCIIRLSYFAKWRNQKRIC